MVIPQQTVNTDPTSATETITTRRSKFTADHEEEGLPSVKRAGLDVQQPKGEQSSDHEPEIISYTPMELTARHTERPAGSTSMR